MRKFLLAFWGILETILIAGGVVFLIRSFLFQPFFVEGSSMVPNFRDGDYLIIDEITYRFREPERGEVIVFKFQNSSNYYIKRIIALPNETVKIESGKIWIKKPNSSFVLLEEPYLKGINTPGDYEVTLKDNEYFVLGDNRYASYDSRYWGPLERKKIIGLVRLRLWPINSVQASFGKPIYNFNF